MSDIHISKKLTRAYIEELLARADSVGMHAVGRALIALNKRQTSDEQHAKEVHHNNAKGFTPYDAEVGTDMANFYERNGYLTDAQVAVWQRSNAKGVPRIAKYWRQLLDDAIEKAGATHIFKGRVPRKRKQVLDDDRPTRRRTPSVSGTGTLARLEAMSPEDLLKNWIRPKDDTEKGS